jgi:sulfatase maturation enzyme AslB (radical SAM superfamily)
MAEKEIKRFSRVDYGDDTTLILSERLLNSLFDHIKDGLNRTEQLVQDMSKVVIVTSEKQDDTGKIIENFKNEYKEYHISLIHVLDESKKCIVSSSRDNTDEHKSTRELIEELNNDILNIKDNIFKFFVTVSAINVVIALVTSILAWYVFFVDK